MAFVFAALTDINAVFIIIGCAVAGLIYSIVVSTKIKEEEK